MDRRRGELKKAFFGLNFQCMRAPLLLLISLSAAAFPQANQYNSTYRGDDGDVFVRKPNAFLVEMTRHRKPGMALDVGMGQGRNTIFLAQEGWDVTGIDPADEGVRQARAEADRLGLKIHAEITTFERFDFGESRWDLIVLMYEPTKDIAPKVERSLKPGGAVIVEDRHMDTRRVWPAGTFADNELALLFPGLRILRYEDVWALSDWSAMKLEERLVRLFAEKPVPRATGCVWKGNIIPEGGRACWQRVMFRCMADGWQFTREQCVP
jgi:SAM-dependent methyltransferase